MSGVKLAISILLCVITSPAVSESTADAVKIFGLIGTWSWDCAQKMDAGGQRVTFSSGFFGSVKQTIVGATATAESEVQSAVRITEDKIKLTLGPASQTSSNSKRTFPGREWLIQKIGPKFKIIDSRDQDGKVFIQNGYLIDPKCIPNCPKDAIEAPVYERCLN